jgi:hypothetical protein
VRDDAAFRLEETAVGLEDRMILVRQVVTGEPCPDLA